MATSAAKMNWIGAHSSPQSAFDGLRDGATIHGLSNGEWSLSDGLAELLRLVGPSDLTISTWTASSADLSKARGFLENDRISSIRFLVDRSFEARQPVYCRTMRDLFGDEAIRVWSSHAKFSILTNGSYSVLYLTSANLNKNKRLENYTVIAGGELPGQYLEMVKEVFEAQNPGEAFGFGVRRARHDTETTLKRRTRGGDVSQWEKELG